MRTLTILVMVAVLAAFGAFAQDDPVMGTWEGKAVGKGVKDAPVHAKVIGLGDRFRVQLNAEGDRWAAPHAVLEGMPGKGAFAAAAGEGDLGALLGPCDLTAVIANGKMEIKAYSKEDANRAPMVFHLDKVVIESPTLGMAPPEGAVVLFDGTSHDAWHMGPGPLDGGTLDIMHARSFWSKQEFGDSKIHVEFMNPYIPTGRGQHRGNSGVYVQHRYEIQVLDSFGDAPADNLCGGIYQIAVPRVCASLPPRQWQTYDITFRAPRFDSQGAKTENARISVEHNGVLIHDNVELPKVTGGAVSEQEAPVGPIFLQNHGEPVSYRNIWVQPLAE
jgi:hypothetical protein